MNEYERTLEDVTMMFESCGCAANVVETEPAAVTLTITGPVSFCPDNYFQEHVARAQEIMQEKFPAVAFTVVVDEAE